MLFCTNTQVGTNHGRSQQMSVSNIAGRINAGRVVHVGLLTTTNWCMSMANLDYVRFLGLIRDKFIYRVANLIYTDVYLYSVHL
jgi:hypothetical protein